MKITSRVIIAITSCAILAGASYHELIHSEDINTQLRDFIVPSKVHFDGTYSHKMDGFGVSLCWWAVGVGGWTNNTSYNMLMDAFFNNRTGLGLNQVRYNIGGSGVGDNEVAKYRAGAFVPAYQDADGSYNWTADATQLRVLHSAVQRGLRYVQAFSNSPPYWMTVSGSATGNGNGAFDNLKADMFPAFASYLANVTEYLYKHEGIVIDSVTPLNEPGSNWWHQGGDQEGCHFSPTSQNKIITLLGMICAFGFFFFPCSLYSIGKELSVRGLPVAVSGPEENSIDDTLKRVQSYDTGGLGSLGVITTHTYNGESRAQLLEFAKKNNKRLWASEYGTGSGPLQGGLQLATRIVMDINVLQPSVWTLWQSADLDNSLSKSGWGLTAATYCGCVNGASCQCSENNQGTFVVRKQYWAYKHFTRFLVPGSMIASTTSPNLVAALDPYKRVVVVVPNTDSSSASLEFDFGQMIPTASCAMLYFTDANNDMNSTKATIQGTTVHVSLTGESVNSIVIGNACGMI
eukprot:m.75646 g.75646  ORF g.75646 m.75646 type:complete len:518 (+) comp12515_c0_seq1:132-1685(+)